MATDRPVNKLLQLLTRQSWQRLEPRLKLERLRARQVLYKPEERIDHVYFPDNAVICHMAVMKNGDTLATATVGLEGASWIYAGIGAPTPCETVVAIGGNAHAIDIHDLDREMQEHEAARDLLTRYSHALLVHSMRLTGCTGLHSLEQRCARWMLTTLDRIEGNQLPVTHEFLAMVLGSSRPAVSTLIETFKKRGILTIERGRMMIGDRDRLLAVSCHCYDAIKRNYEQMARLTTVRQQTDSGEAESLGFFPHASERARRRDR